MTGKKPGLTITVEVDDFTRDLLTGAGWTPPGEEPILNTEHRRILAKEKAGHDAAIGALVSDQRRAFDRLRHQHQEELDRQAKEHHVALREARKKSSAAIRAEVAEEIAKDLERPREWRMSPEEPAPWARIARAHAGRNPGGDTVCTVCTHTVVQHGHGGCWAARRGDHDKVCDCPHTHGRSGPYWETDVPGGEGRPSEVFTLRLSAERLSQLRRLAFKRQLQILVFARNIIHGQLDNAINNAEITRT